MERKTVLTPTDLHTDDFDIQDGKVVIKIDRFQYKVQFSKSIESGNPVPSLDDNLVTIQHGLGVIRLDFKEVYGHTDDSIATLPANCPTPINRIEAQLYDGRMVYIDAGSRDIKMSTNLYRNRRYVITLIGFFN